MKKNTTNKLSLRRMAARFVAWIHLVIEKKGEYIEACAWYPSPCQTEFPF